MPRGEKGYTLISVYGHSNCPGNYVTGAVTDAQNNPLAGVRLTYVDQWGNRATTMSKNGPTDYGQFDFGISSGSPHEIYITIVNDTGIEISNTAVIQHRQGENPDLPCHHVVFRQHP